MTTPPTTAKPFRDLIIEGAPGYSLTIPHVSVTGPAEERYEISTHEWVVTVRGFDFEGRADTKQGAYLSFLAQRLGLPDPYRVVRYAREYIAHDHEGNVDFHNDLFDAVQQYEQGDQPA